MTKDEIIAALDKMLEQGNQLRASELVPALKAIVDSPGGGGEGVTIDLTGYTLGEDPVDITEAVPTGFTPSVTDRYKVKLGSLSGEFQGFLVTKEYYAEGYSILVRAKDLPFNVMANSEAPGKWFAFTRYE